MTGTSLLLFKVDAVAHQSTGAAYGVKSFPTLKWFEDGKLTVCCMQLHAARLYDRRVLHDVI